MTIRDLLAKSPSVALSSQQRLDWLRLARSQGVGPYVFGQLLSRYHDAATALEAYRDTIKRTGQGRLCSLSEAEEEFAITQRLGAKLVCQGEAEYPSYLGTIPDPPPVVTILGNPAFLHRSVFAIVGSRNASLAGLRQTRHMAAELGKTGFVIASGLARGIDGAAHQGALATGTIAVMAGGIDVIYPPEHRRLYQEIADQGVLICEHPPGTPTKPRLFPRRNRIVSGLSRGVLIVEATQRSGSLITARLGAEQGRDIFAIPGSPRDPRARGCNRLIRDGAILVESIEDILTVIPPPDQSQNPPSTDPHSLDPKDEPTDPASYPPLPEPNTPLKREENNQRHPDQTTHQAREAIIHCLSSTPTTVDDLMRHGDIEPQIVKEVLLEMELAGRIYRLPGNRISIL